MKLDKVEITQKKKNKKAIIIGASTIAVLTFGGVAGCMLFKDGNNGVIKFAQSIISGQTTVLGEVESKPSEELSPETLKSLRNYMKKTGFGYSSYNVDTFSYGIDGIDNYDKAGNASPTEKLYLMYNKNETYTYHTSEGNLRQGKIEDKPQYVEEDPGEKPELKSITFKANDDTNPGETTYYVKAYYIYKGETIESETMKAGIFVGDTADLKEEEARNSIKEKYEADCMKWAEEKEAYNKWEAWKTKRNDWLKEMKDAGYFEKKEIDSLTEWESYDEFWAKLAIMSLGLSDTVSEGINEEEIDELINYLYAQLYDEDNQPRENVNILLKSISEEGYTPYEPAEGGNGGSGGGVTGGDDSSSGGGGSSSGGGGSTGGGSSSGGGGSTGGGSSSGGGGSTGGGSTGGGSNTTGGDTTEETEDKVAPSIEKASIISPVSGNYTKGQEIKIKIDFDKNVYGTNKKVAIDKDTAPKLMIKFGDEGENKLATFNSASGKSIIYTYIVEETDNGQLQIGTGDNYIGTVYNESGYKVDLKKIEKLETGIDVKADNQGPKVEKIEVISEKGEYKTGSDIQIKVTFNEKVYTAKNKITLLDTTAPVLNISFGEGEVRHPLVQEIKYSYVEEKGSYETYIIYQYKITSEDRGALKLDGAKAFDGTKKIYDEIGNEVTLIAGKDLTGNEITVNSDLAQITLDKEEITLDLNGTKTAKIIATVTPSGTDLTWESSDSGVATIDKETGTVTALAIGETNITVKTNDGAEAICKVTVKDTTKGVTKVELNKDKLELDLNGTKTADLTATVTPEQLEVTWDSTKKEIVTVDKNGKVTALAKGEAEIIAKAKDGTTATCKVKVIDSDTSQIEPTSIELNIQNVKVVLGKTETIQLRTTITPANSNKNTKITYESSDKNVATVDNEGKVSIKAKGTTVITATSENGQKAYCAIEVEEVTADSKLSNKIIGDVNEDGKIDTTDLLLILRHIATSSSEQIAEKHQDWKLESDKYVLADIKQDGVIDTTDTVRLLRHIAVSKSDSIKTEHSDWTIETNWK